MPNRISYTPYPSPGGFTLLEVMIAMAILAIVLVAVFQSQSQSLSMTANARFLTTASFLAQHRISELEAAGFENIPTTSGGFGDDYPDYSWQLDLVDTGIKLLKKITLKVTNRQLSSNNEYIIVYYAYRKK